MANDEPNRGRDKAGAAREQYRHDNDQRNRTPEEDRLATRSDTKSEARGDARESIGNTAHEQYGNPDADNRS